MSTAECEARMEWNVCAADPSCDQKCDNYGQVACIALCSPRCACPKGKPIRHEGTCIAHISCPCK